MTITENKVKENPPYGWKDGTKEAGRQLTLDGGHANDQTMKKRRLELPLGFSTVVLKNKRRWNKLFSDFDEMRAITYVSSPEYILTLYSEQGYEKVEVLIGQGLVSSWKSHLDDDMGAIARLFEHIEEGSLTVYGTKATVHTKMYILSKSGMKRVIVGSPNLSFKASGSRQREYCWYWDLYDNNELDQDLLAKFEMDYQAFMDEPDRVEFMQDLIDLCDENPDSAPSEVFELWSRDNLGGESRAVRAMFDEIYGQAFQEREGGDEEIIHITIPKVIKKAQTKFLTANFGATITGEKVTIPVAKALTQNTMSGIVPMRIDDQSGEIKIGVCGKWELVPKDVSDADISRGLEDIERYISPVDRATCSHPAAVKMMLMETMLFAMAAPFVNHLHAEKMKVTQIADRRGPRHLLLLGDGHNGKTALGRYLNFLISGRVIEPVPAKQWTKKEWVNLFHQAQVAGSSFPIPIDDIKSSCLHGKNATLEGFVKSYWEENWRPGLKFPMMILNTNHEDLEEWAKTRVRRLELNVRYKENAGDMKLLNELMSGSNLTFAAFSQEYLSQLARGVEYDLDDLRIARAVMQNLYHRVGRELPSYFPHRPPEEIYDMDAISCYDKKRYGIILKERRKRGAIILEFSNRHSLHNFRSRLPAEVVSKFDNNLLIIMTPKEYREFMRKGKPKRLGFLSRWRSE